MITEISFTDVLLESAKEVFETMIFMTVDENFDKLSVEGDCLLGSITFTGNIEGCLAMSYPQTNAKNIAANMLGLDVDDDISDDDVRDAIGEIANMVMGSIKARLMQQGVGNLEVSIPCVVTGKELTSSLGDKARRINETIIIDDEPAELTFLYRSKE